MLFLQFTIDPYKVDTVAIPFYRREAKARRWHWEDVGEAGGENQEQQVVTSEEVGMLSNIRKLGPDSAFSGLLVFVEG